MKRKLSIIVVLISVLCLTGECATVPNDIRIEYGHLKSAAEAAGYAINGEYGKAIPSDLNDAKFMQVVKGKIADQYYRALKKYPFTVKAKGTYYLLIVRSPDTQAVIFFDFSCTPQVDGLVYLNPGKFDTNNLDQYDPCAATHQ